jgi:hypothetical protein
LALFVERLLAKLCGIWFASQEGLERFMANNPGLNATVLSESPTGFTVWLRIEGFCPRTQDLGTCMWQSDGAWVMVYNRDVFGPEFKLRRGSVIVQIPFGQLVLGSVAEKAVRHQMVESLYGKPFASDEHGRNQLNYSYWAYYFGSDRGLKYHPGQKRFMRWKGEENRWCPIHQETVMNELQQFLFHFGQASGLKILQNILPEKDLLMLLKNLKIVAVGDFAEEADGLDAFLAERVEHKRGYDVTTEEMFLAYSCFCQNHRVPALTKHEFTRKLPILMKEKFGITPGHSLIRDGGARRGYRHVALRALETFGTLGTLRTHD